MPAAVSDTCKQLYDNSYAEMDAEWRHLSATPKVNNIIKACDTIPHSSVLEIGAGEGAILSQLSDRSFGDNLYALEICERAIEALESKKIESLRECRLFDGSDVPWPDHTFDVVILSHVVEHLEYPRQLLYEAGRVAEYVFVEVPLEDNWRLPRDFVADNVGHINFYSMKTIRRLLQTCGFEILSQTPHHVPYEVYGCQNRRLTALLKYSFKESLFRVWPSLAAKIMTYHCSLLCRRKSARSRAS